VLCSLFERSCDGVCTDLGVDRAHCGGLRGAPAWSAPARRGSPIATGDSQTGRFPLDTNGTARCWGYNGYGQLGERTTTDRLATMPVTGITMVARMTGGQYHTCARISDGSVRCWGENNYGQLGDGTTTDRTTPVTVVDLSDGTTCSVVAGSPSAETCNNIDDNCNGVIDDGLSCP
jgi:hypothetical protein